MEEVVGDYSSLCPPVLFHQTDAPHDTIAAPDLLVYVDDDRSARRVYLYLPRRPWCSYLPHLFLPNIFQSCIQSLVRVAQPFLDALTKTTGWNFTLMGGGPEPAHGGLLNIIRYELFVSFFMVWCLTVLQRAFWFHPRRCQDEFRSG